jgi:hypothetical protein
MTLATAPRRHWVAWHLHIDTLGSGATDEVVRQVVGPAVAFLRQHGRTTSWFFMRYWQLGPHVRLRVADLPAGCHPAMDRLLQNHLADVSAGATGPPLTQAAYQAHAAPLAMAGEQGRCLPLGRLRHPGVYRERYWPEHARYGGPALLPESEALFEEASELALSFVALGPPEAARSGLGLRATQAALGVLPDDGHRLRFCRRAAAAWQAWAGGENGGEMPPAPPRERLGGPPPAPVRRWVNRLESAMTLWRRAVGEEEAQRILHAHIHMLHNRLGLSVAQECRHYRALAESLSDPERNYVHVSGPVPGPKQLVTP